jgi:DNA-binding LacI/PurR family transcriptional regulator
MTTNVRGTPGGQRPARIKDVAALAGVSWKTVSNVVHDKPNVGQETRERVQAVIDQLGYQPDPAGRQLRRGRSDTVTLVVPEIGSPYFAALAHAVIEAARGHGLAVCIEETGGDPRIERQVAGSLSVRTFDGVIFSPISADLASMQFLQKKIPTVFLGEYIAGSDVDHLTYDSISSVREATTHLIETGRRRIAFLGAQHHRRNRTADLRLQGYREALDEAGIAFTDDLVIPALTYQREPGASGTRKFLRRKTPIDAMVCGNDLLAMGALYALRLAGVRVPDDVAVVGWDDIPDGRYSNPTLTTVSPDIEQLADMTIRALVRRMDNPGASMQQHVPGHRLVVRESTACS